jgi:uncharacterized repeat protein (TIGR01451 family)
MNLVARAGQLIVVAAAILLASAGLARAQSPLHAGDIVVVDWLDGHSRVLRIDPQTHQRFLVTDLTIHGPAGTWPAAPRARGLVARDPSTLYVIVQTEEFDPTDPFAATNGINCYPFPFPKATCGAVLAVDGQTGARTMLADFGDLTQADPSLPTSRALGAWPIAAVVRSNDLLVVDKDYPTTFGVNNPRFGAMWRVVTSGPTAGLRSVVSDFADSSQGPFGADPFAIAQDASGRVLVVDRAAFGSGIVNCNPDPTSPPVGCGAVFQIDPDGTRHLLIDLGNNTGGGQPVQADSGLAIAVTPDGRTFLLSQTGGGLGCPFASTNGSCAALFELHPDPMDPYRHSRTLFSDFGDGGVGGDVGVFGLAVSSDGKLLVTGCAGSAAHGSVPSVCTIDPTGTGQRIVLSDFGDTLQQDPGLSNGGHSPLPLGIAVVPPEGPSTTTALTASPSPSTYGQSVTLTSSVTSAAGTPTGQVAFADGSSAIATVSLAGGTATTTTSALTAGSHTLRANYLGDAGFNPSTGTTTLVVDQASTTVGLTSSVNPAAPGQTVTFTATVAPQFAGTPTGTITFRDGATILGAIAMVGGTASFDTNTLAVGSHSVTATYDGDTNFTTSASTLLTQVIGSAADLAITLVANPAQAAVGSNVTLTVTVVNKGTADATNVVARVTLAPGLGFASSTGGAYDSATGNWTVGSIANGASAALQVVATVLVDSPSVTARIVSADQGDPNPANNMVTVTITPPGIFVGVGGCTLRSAIVAANTDAPFGGCTAGRPGLDTIFLPPTSSHVYRDVYESPTGIGPDALPAVTSPIVIEGRGALIARDTSFGTPTMRVFFVKAGGSLTLHDVTVSNGVGSGGGGGILLEGSAASLVVDSSRIVGNSATDFGGGISSGLSGAADNGAITITNSLIAGNSVGPGTFPGFGGGVSAGAALTITNSTIGPGSVAGVSYGGNFAGRSGGGIFAQGTATIRSSDVVQNVSDNGGGIRSTSSLTLENTTATSNVANVLGGGIYATGTTIITGGTIAGNTALDGGGIFNSGRATLTNVTVSQNVAPSGGGIDNRGAVALSGSRVVQNVAASQGGGIFNLFTNDLGAGAQLTLDTTTISANSTGGNGGGVLTLGPVTIVNSAIGGPTDPGNTAMAAGGGIMLVGGGVVPASLTMTGGTIGRNVANGSWAVDGGGGGIANGGASPGGSVILNAVSVGGNQAPNGDGGGIFNRGPLAMNGGTLAGNSALTGGGFANGSDGLPGGVGVTLTGVIISGNVVFNRGGGLENDSGTLTVSGGGITFNRASHGGGLSNLHFDATPLSAVELRDGVVVADNVASGSGGGVLVGGGSVFNMTGGAILRNVANGSWDTFGGGGGLANGNGLGGLFAGGTATLTDVLVADNQAPNGGDGGGVFNRGPLTIIRGVMSGNVAGGAGAGSGGAIANGSGAFSGGSVTLTGSTLSSNTASVFGGGISNISGSSTLTNVAVDTNSAISAGGNVFLGTSGGVIVDGGSITNGRAPAGGGIFAESALTVRNGAIVSDNTATGPDGGGGAYVTGTSPIAFSNATVRRNHAPNGGGGAIHAAGATSLSIQNSSLSNNDAGSVAAILADGTPTGTSVSLVASTLNGNQSSTFFSTSALQLLAGSNALVSNTTISGNGANEGYLVANYGTMRIMSSTIVDNTAAFGVFSSGDVLSLVNTIVAGNHSEPAFGSFSLDCYHPGPAEAPTTIVSNGYNLLGTGCVVAATDASVDPAAVFTKVLAPLADNGGPTLTHALLPGSPALDAANPFAIGALSCDPTDQRGLPRPKDGDGDGVGRCDIGAFEQQTPLPGPLIPTSFSPVSAVRGGPAFTLTVKGTAFTIGSTVLWNGAARPTTFVSTKQLQAAIPASDLATADDVTAVLIGVARPDGATSNVQVNSAYFWVVGSTVAGGPTFVSIDSGSSKTVTNAGQGLPGGAVTATVTNNGAGSSTAVVEVATYASNPVPGSVFSAGGFFDVQIIGADSTDTAALSFYYPATITGPAEAALQLLYWTGSAWAPVVGSGGVAPVKNTADNLDGTMSGGRFSLTVDSTSTPRITDLTGTIFAIAAVPQPPQVALQGVLADLRALRKATTNRNDGLRLDVAIQSVTLALDARLWHDPTHLQPPPTGAGVYVGLAGAIVPLHAILGDPRSSIPTATARSYIDRILDVGRRLALVAIGDAQTAGGNPQAISRASHEISDGDAAVTRKEFEVAVADDGLAWGNAELALPSP